MEHQGTDRQRRDRLNEFMRVWGIPAMLSAISILLGIIGAGLSNAADRLEDAQKEQAGAIRRIELQLAQVVPVSEFRMLEKQVQTFQVRVNTRFPDIAIGSRE